MTLFVIMNAVAEVRIPPPLWLADGARHGQRAVPAGDAGSRVAGDRRLAEGDHAALREMRGQSTAPEHEHTVSRLARCVTVRQSRRGLALRQRWGKIR